MKGTEGTLTITTKPEQAHYLGSTPRTVLVRCPCGRRNYFERQGWSWLEVAFCVRCWQGILYHNLTLISRWEGERMLREDLVFAGELKLWRSMEAKTRRFLLEFHEEPVWMWPVKVVRHAQSVEADLLLADQMRGCRGAEPSLPLAELPAETGAQGFDLTDEQKRLLSLFAKVPEEHRARLLAVIEQEASSAAEGAEDDAL